jgi:hypothetical protein
MAGPKDVLERSKAAIAVDDEPIGDPTYDDAYDRLLEIVQRFTDENDGLACPLGHLESIWRMDARFKGRPFMERLTDLYNFEAIESNAGGQHYRITPKGEKMRETYAKTKARESAKNKAAQTSGAGGGGQTRND